MLAKFIALSTTFYVFSPPKKGNCWPLLLLLLLLFDCILPRNGRMIKLKTNIYFKNWIIKFENGENIENWYLLIFNLQHLNNFSVQIITKINPTTNNGKANNSGVRTFPKCFAQHSKISGVKGNTEVQVNLKKVKTDDW